MLTASNEHKQSDDSLRSCKFKFHDIQSTLFVFPIDTQTVNLQSGSFKMQSRIICDDSTILSSTSICITQGIFVARWYAWIRFFCTRSPLKYPKNLNTTLTFDVLKNVTNFSKISSSTLRFGLPAIFWNLLTS